MFAVVRGIFRGVEDSGENCVRFVFGGGLPERSGEPSHVNTSFSTRTFPEHVEHLLSSVVVRILCSLCSILHLFFLMVAFQAKADRK